MLRSNGTAARGLRASGRWKLVLVVVAVALTVGVGAAYGVLGSHDTAYGTAALASENGGNNNSAFGFQALVLNTTGIYNTGVGVDALAVNTTGCCNTATGAGALGSNVSHDNTATGFQALYNNGSGADNTATGTNALRWNATGSADVAVGRDALFYNSTGSNNTAVGRSAGIGGTANTTGSQNTYLGFNTGSGASDLTNATAVGANAVVSQSDSLVLGASGVNVGINNSAPKSRLQIGSGATDTGGEYLQIPLLLSDAKTPPAADCDNASEFGRLVLVQKKKKGTLWACLSPGVWAKL